VLKGSSDAHDTNKVVVGLMHDVLAEHGLNPDGVFLAPPEREWLPQILQAVGYIDLAIPRGSKGLIDFVRDNASIPVIETGAGIVHTYLDASADLNQAQAIITNAKTRRVSVCNALDTLLLHRELLGELPRLMQEMGEDFHRDPSVKPDISRYNALIILGGPQMPDQGKQYPHLNEEMRCIEEALKREIPVLGICLGAQLLAYTLGGNVKPMKEWEIGWYNLAPTPSAAADPLFCSLTRPHPVFQWHGYTFDLPAGAMHLAQSKTCTNQAFRYGRNAYGLQCHLELDERLINRWLHLPEYLQDLEANGRRGEAPEISRQTHELIGQSIALSSEIFGQFLSPLGERRSRHILPSR
jgi:GMP synthase (glutamine-hydrolysing)